MAEEKIKLNESLEESSGAKERFSVTVLEDDEREQKKLKEYLEKFGSENGVEPLADASVVVSAYEAPHGAKGLIGIVGPTRMDYAKVCARLEKFAEGLSRMLTEQEGTEDQHGEGK